MRKIIAIIQARMGSTRLPGKVLKELSGNSMLWHVIDRVKRSDYIKDIVVATSKKSSDDALANIAEKNGALVFRGSEEDVLNRYYRAAKKFNADIIVRITSDCPLIDPRVSDKVIRAFLAEQCDYCSNTLKRTYPRGLDTEVFSFDALERADKYANKKYEREHVTAYIEENPTKFFLKSVENDVDLSGHRWTVDTPEDFDFVRKVYKSLYCPGRIFHMEDVVALLEDNPELAGINRHIKQKEMK